MREWISKRKRDGEDGGGAGGGVRENDAIMVMIVRFSLRFGLLSGYFTYILCVFNSLWFGTAMERVEVSGLGLDVGNGNAV